MDRNGAAQPKHEKKLPPDWQEREYLTGEEVAILLRASEKSVWRWVKKDCSMPALRIGGRVRFPRERLLRWLRQREQGPGRAPRSAKLMHSDTEPLENANGSRRQDVAMGPSMGHLS